MRDRPTSAGPRQRPRWAVAAATTAAVLVASAVSASDETYRSAHGFALPVPSGFVRIDPARGGLRGKEGVEASFVRPATADDDGPLSLDVAFQPIADWRRRSMARIAHELGDLAVPSAPGMTVERFTPRSDPTAEPDRFELESLARMRGTPAELTLLMARAGRDGIAYVLLSGPPSADARMRAEFALLREGLRFDPELVYRPPDTDGSWGDALLYVVFTAAVMGLVVVLQLRRGRTTSRPRRRS